MLLALLRRQLTANKKGIHWKVAKRCGRPTILSKADHRYLFLCSKGNRRKTIPVLTEEFNVTSKTPVSSSVIRSSLIRSGLSGRVAARKPFVREKNIKKRLEFALEHFN